MDFVPVILTLVATALFFHVVDAALSELARARRSKAAVNRLLERD